MRIMGVHRDKLGLVVYFGLILPLSIFGPWPGWMRGSFLTKPKFTREATTRRDKVVQDVAKT